MMKVTWARHPALKRVLALAGLAYLAYLGYTRLAAIARADDCRDSGGTYDTVSDICRR